MKTQAKFSRSWPLCQGLTAIIVTLALAGSSAWAKKPPKPPPEPPPEPQAGCRLVDLVGPEGGQSVAWRINAAGWVVGEAPQPDRFGPCHEFVVIPEDTKGDGEPDRWARNDNGGGFNDLLIDLGVLGGGY